MSASRTGTIAYAENIRQNGRLTWLDRGGQLLAAATPEGEYADFRLSPDDQHLGASLVDPKSNVLEAWITNLARGSSARLMTGTSATAAIVWSPDGSSLTFRSNRTGAIEFYQRSAQGGGSDRLIAVCG